MDEDQEPETGACDRCGEEHPLRTLGDEDLCHGCTVERAIEHGADAERGMRRISVRIPEQVLSGIKVKVADGVYASRSEGIRAGARAAAGLGPRKGLWKGPGAVDEEYDAKKRAEELKARAGSGGE